MVFLSGSSPRYPLDGAVILAHTRGGGKERRGEERRGWVGAVQEVRWVSAARGYAQEFVDGSICVTLRRICFKGKHHQIY